MSTDTNPSFRDALGRRLIDTGLRYAAPLWLVGWTVMRLGGNRAPNLGWDVAHSLWIVAFLLFGAAIAGLYRRAVQDGRRSPAPTAALLVAGIGTVALVGQMLCDLVVGLISADPTAMNTGYDRVFAVPGVHLLLFQLGPVLMFVGLLTLSLLAWRRRMLPGPAAALVTVGIAALAIGKGLPGWWRVIEGLGVGCLALAYAPLADAAPVAR